jgi:hypothetical protein
MQTDVAELAVSAKASVTAPVSADTVRIPELRCTLVAPESLDLQTVAPALTAGYRVLRAAFCWCDASRHSIGPGSSVMDRRRGTHAGCHVFADDARRSDQARIRPLVRMIRSRIGRESMGRLGALAAMLAGGGLSGIAAPQAPDGALDRTILPIQQPAAM